jgi:hypothetical protein
MVPIVYLSMMVPTNLVFTTVYSIWRKRHPVPEDAEAVA